MSTPWKGIVGHGFTPTEFETYVRGLSFVRWRPNFVVLHNTAVPTIAQWHEHSGLKRMRGLEDYYRNLGWPAGPHLFIADDLIWVFTPLTTAGVHSPSWNRVAWGVEMVGDYAKESFQTGAGQKVRDNTVSAMATLHAAIGLDSHSLKLHKEDPLTTHNCPGKKVVKADMIRRVHDEIVARHNGEHHPGEVGAEFDG
jgi:hypothetical protein